MLPSSARLHAVRSSAAFTATAARTLPAGQLAAAPSTRTEALASVAAAACEPRARCCAALREAPLASETATSLCRSSAASARASSVTVPDRNFTCSAAAPASHALAIERPARTTVPTAGSVASTVTATPDCAPVAARSWRLVRNTVAVSPCTYACVVAALLPVTGRRRTCALLPSSRMVLSLSSGQLLSTLMETTIFTSRSLSWLLRYLVNRPWNFVNSTLPRPNASLATMSST